MMNKPKVATYSIIGFDPATGETGIAVQSKFLGVGAVVPWAEAGTGAVATQSFANTAFGPDGLELLKKGFSAEEVVEKLIADDEEAALRQFAIMDADGKTAAYTGSECFDWAGHRAGNYCTAQGNILKNKETVEHMITSFESSKGPLAERLLNALDAAQAAGGDSRGKQSAAMFIVQQEGGYGGYNDRKYDLRVDDHKEPIDELRRLYELHRLYFTRPDENDLLELNGEVLQEVQSHLQRENLLAETKESYTDEVKAALEAYFMQENFEERWQDDHKIDPAVLTFMRSRKES
ncbi:DUF1028 domain-containing protein [Alkalicoccus luteus]|uniref:DUF1028 domain-containing protein n=1 Tax=Alkalicoccus luteus TaxID=1237094 RepID=A0A969PNJ8_9BACI|nr:DUF1028 domain-containing protein [Alkalicoccus luteus]NJP36675.1 DUF1028 domain-containing protein [Alkalicoccus luteus]